MMMRRALIVDAFTRDGSGGNPAGVVIDDGDLSVEQMQKIAAELRLSETAFVQIINAESAAVRFFTPTDEVALCGHATVAAHHALLGAGKIGPGSRTMLTKAGPQSIVVSSDGLVSMTQNKPIFGSVLDRFAVAEALGVSIERLHGSLPVQMASTGLQKIFAPLRDLSSLLAIEPNLPAIDRLSRMHGAIGIYCYAFDDESGATAHCRNFAPVVGIAEDAATGTSAAALSCLLHHFGILGQHETIHCRYEQGDCIDRPSELLVRLTIKNEEVDGVWVSGRAVHVQTKTL